MNKRRCPPRHHCNWCPPPSPALDALALPFARWLPHHCRFHAVIAALGCRLPLSYLPPRSDFVSLTAPVFFSLLTVPGLSPCVRMEAPWEPALVRIAICCLAQVSQTERVNHFTLCVPSEASQFRELVTCQLYYHHLTTWNAEMHRLFFFFWRLLRAQFSVLLREGNPHSRLQRSLPWGFTILGFPPVIRLQRPFSF